MKTLADPPVSHWHPRSLPDQDRSVLIQITRHWAQHLGSAVLPANVPVWATGHQAWLWHPGILAKDVAMSRAAGVWGSGGGGSPLPTSPASGRGENASRGGVLHVVVDQDVHQALELALPLVRGRRLELLEIQLGKQEKLVPAAAHPPIDPASVLEALDAVDREHGADIPVDLSVLRKAWVGLPAVHTLAQQLAVVLHRLMLPYTGPLSLLMATDTLHLPAYRFFIGAILADPTYARTCAHRYNQAVADFPQARLGPLRLEDHRVELPLWYLPWRGQRQRVFVVFSGAGSQLQSELGQPLDPFPVGMDVPPSELPGRLAPKALLLTALLRSDACDLFVHGKGGAIYDQVMEPWWQSVTGLELAPRTLVSADMYLDLNIPQATSNDLAKAIWLAHHLPHNLDRQLHLTDERSIEKRRLLEQMTQTRDRQRKAVYFARIHQINESLVQEHPGALRQAQEQVGLARDGLANRALAQRRDWCFAIYDPAALGQLGQGLFPGVGFGDQAAGSGGKE